MLHSGSITKTCLYNFDPLKPHFYIVKLGFTGVHIIFLIFAQTHRGRSNGYPQYLCFEQKYELAEAVLTSSHNLCFEQKYEQHQSFYLKTQFLVVKFSTYLNRRVFVLQNKNSEISTKRDKKIKN